MLLSADESEALTHPYLAHAWAKRGADLRVPAPTSAAATSFFSDQVFQYDWSNLIADGALDSGVTVSWNGDAPSSFAGDLLLAAVPPLPPGGGPLPIDDPSPVPEPTSVALLVLGLGWLGLRRGRGGAAARACR